MTRNRLAITFAVLFSSQPLLAQQQSQYAPPAFDTRALSAHTRFLSSDALEGRGPGTRADALTVAYISSQFEAAGVEPAGENGTYLQKVPLIGVNIDPQKSSVAFTKAGAPTIGPLQYLDQWVGQDQSQSASAQLDSELVFVGHGVVAPEYKWDDYRGFDARGKTLVMLVDDPPANAKEPNLFKGIARTYYGRWTYKFEIGTAKNADGVILIHTNDAAGYGWSVVRNSWSGEQSYMHHKEGAHALRFSGWMTEDVAKQLFAAAGQDLAKLTALAATRNFKPVPLGYRLNASIASNVRPFNTWNVIGKVTGSNPQLKEQGVIYSAHHDHIGIGRADEHGDMIYNGAIDNATGVAVLIEMARAFASAPQKTKRSIFFAAVAAEEQGLLGSQWLGEHPPIPAGKIALGLNYDAIGLYGRVSNVQAAGADRTTFYPTVTRIASAAGLTITPDAHPEQGSYYRSDHFSLAKWGIPAFSIREGEEVIGKPGAGKSWNAAYRANNYHQPSDQFDPTWDFSTAAQMAEFGYVLGAEAANATEVPTWKSGDEFLAARERSYAAIK